MTIADTLGLAVGCTCLGFFLGFQLLQKSAMEDQRRLENYWTQRLNRLQDRQLQAQAENCEANCKTLEQEYKILELRTALLNAETRIILSQSRIPMMRMHRKMQQFQHHAFDALRALKREEVRAKRLGDVVWSAWSLLPDEIKAKASFDIDGSLMGRTRPDLVMGMRILLRDRAQTDIDAANIRALLSDTKNGDHS